MLLYLALTGVALILPPSFPVLVALHLAAGIAIYSLRYLPSRRSVDMEFHYAEDFDGIAIPGAYERLLLDAIQGDASLFLRRDGIELSWQIMDPVIHAWASKDAPPLARYERGSWGPSEADALLARNGRTWERGCGVH